MTFKCLDRMSMHEKQEKDYNRRCDGCVQFKTKKFSLKFHFERIRNDLHKEKIERKSISENVFILNYMRINRNRNTKFKTFIDKSNHTQQQTYFSFHIVPQLSLLNGIENI